MSSIRSRNFREIINSCTREEAEVSCLRSMMAVMRDSLDAQHRHCSVNFRGTDPFRPPSKLRAKVLGCRWIIAYLDESMTICQGVSKIEDWGDKDGGEDKRTILPSVFDNGLKLGNRRDGRNTFVIQAAILDMK